MPLAKQKKEEIVNDLRGWLEKSGAVIFLNFHGLATSLSDELRSLLREAGARYFVVKKTLVKRAFELLKFSGEMPALEGEIALVLGGESGDASAMAKILSKFRKKHAEISLLGGILDKAFIGEKAVVALAELPSREVLIARFINVINAPRRGLVVTLSGVMRNFTLVLSGLASKKRS